MTAGKAGLVTELKGNKYDYYIDATFTDTSGTGKREEGAGILGGPCSFEFTKQTGSDTKPARHPAAGTIEFRPLAAMIPPLLFAHEFHAPVLRLACCCVVGVDGLRGAKPSGGQPAALMPNCDTRMLFTASARRFERSMLWAGVAGGVGVPVDFQVQVGRRRQPRGRSSASPPPTRA